VTEADCVNRAHRHNHRRLRESDRRIRSSATLPSMYEREEFVDAGGLASYGTNFPAMYLRGAIYVARIVGGNNPRNLPVVRPTKNLKTTKAMDFSVPRALLLRADKVIE
jgi:putative tryptophan/tyrosine transport system substrate-binding protein